MGWFSRKLEPKEIDKLLGKIGGLIAVASINITFSESRDFIKNMDKAQKK